MAIKIVVGECNMDNKTKIIIGLILVIVLIAGAFIGASFIPPKVVEKPIYVQPQVIKGEAVTQSEISVKPITTPDSVVEILNTGGKVIVQSDGKQIEVPNTTGKPTMELGKDSTLMLKNSYEFKVDVADMVRAQVNDKLAIQAAELKKKYVKNNTLAVEVTNLDLSVNYTHKNIGVTVGKTWDGKIRVGPRYEVKW